MTPVGAKALVTTALPFLVTVALGDGSEADGGTPVPGMTGTGGVIVVKFGVVVLGNGAGTE